MSGGNQLYRAALGACLATLLFVTPALAQQDVEKPTPTVNEGQGVAGEAPSPEEDSRENAEREETPPADPLPAPPTVDNEADTEPACGPRCEAAQQREEADLVAQESMADSTKEIAGLTEGQLWIGGVGVTLLIVTLIITARATNAAVAANKLHERAARQAERAWLKVDAKLLDNVQFDERGDASFRIKFKAKNIGKSPAFAVDVHAKVYLFAPDWDRPDTAQLKFARTIRDIEQNDRGAIVFPGDDWKRTPKLKIWSSDAKRARKQTKDVKGADDGCLFPVIIGCVQYLTRPDDKSPSQTGFIYAIRVRRAGESPGGLLDGMNPDSKDVVLEKLFLDPHAVT